MTDRNDPVLVRAQRDGLLVEVERLRHDLMLLRKTEERRESARDGAYTVMCRLEQENRKLRALLKKILDWAGGGCALDNEIEATLAGKTRTPCSEHKGFKEDCGCP